MRFGCRPDVESRQFLGWSLATIIVLAAVFGPPLTGQSIPAMLELRHDILMIDREFERWAIRTNKSAPQTCGSCAGAE